MLSQIETTSYHKVILVHPTWEQLVPYSHNVAPKGINPPVLMTRLSSGSVPSVSHPPADLQSAYDGDLSHLVDRLGGRAPALAPSPTAVSRGKSASAGSAPVEEKAS